MAPTALRSKGAARPTVATGPPAETNCVSVSFGCRTAADQAIGKNLDMPPSEPGSNGNDRDVLTSLPRTRPARRSAKRDRPARGATPPAAPDPAAPTPKAARPAAGPPPARRARRGRGERHAGPREGDGGVEAQAGGAAPQARGVRERRRAEGEGAVLAGEAGRREPQRGGQARRRDPAPGRARRPARRLRDERARAPRARSVRARLDGGACRRRDRPDRRDTVEPGGPDGDQPLSEAVTAVSRPRRRVPCRASAEPSRVPRAKGGGTTAGPNAGPPGRIGPPRP